jgi:two-component system response regulator NreC
MHSGKEGKAAMSIRIILADDHKIIRDGLRTLLETEADMEVVAEADNGRKAITRAGELMPDVVIMDITMPDMNGIDATRDIIREVPGVKVIALSMHSDRRFVTGMLEAGAKGYLLKDCAFDELARAIRTVVSNHTYLSPRITNIVIDSFVRKSDTTDAAFSILTWREREVLQLLADGKTTKETAFHLNVSLKTVESHRRNIMDKLNINTKTDLVRYAIREGLTTLEP